MSLLSHQVTLVYAEVDSEFHSKEQKKKYFSKKEENFITQGDEIIKYYELRYK